MDDGNNDGDDEYLAFWTESDGVEFTQALTQPPVLYLYH